MKEAFTNSLAKVEDKNQLMQGKTITKSISPVKKRPVPSKVTRSSPKTKKVKTVDENHSSNKRIKPMKGKKSGH
jgi:hypothetical protein